MPSKDPEKRREASRKYIQNNREKHNASGQRWSSSERGTRRRAERYQELRQTVIIAYGGKCVCCGITEPKFLTIDHINNNGALERKSFGLKGRKMYAWLVRNNFPKDNYQLLCYNCNCTKGFYGRCPHEDSVDPAGP